MASITAGAVAAIYQSSFCQDVLQRLPGVGVELMFSGFQFEQDGAGPGTVGSFGFFDRRHSSLLEQGPSSGGACRWV